MKKLLLAAALALTPVSLLAQSASPAPTAPAARPAALPDADPALWVVRDADTTIYLFGTFHLLDGRPWFNDEVRAAFDASDELVLEARIPENPAELQPLNPHAFYELAKAHHALNHVDDVRKIIKRVSEFNPDVTNQLIRETGLLPYGVEPRAKTGRA